MRNAFIEAVTEIGEMSDWQEFLIAVQKERISLFFVLKSGRLLRLTQTVLQIGVDKDPYFKELTRQDNRRLMEALASKFFGRSLAIIIQLIPPCREFIICIEEDVSNKQVNDPDCKVALEVLGGTPVKRRREERIKVSDCRVIETDGENYLLCDGLEHLILQPKYENNYKLLGRTECNHNWPESNTSIKKTNA